MAKILWILGYFEHEKKKNGKCFKISNIFLFLFANKMLVIRTGTNKILFRIANREDPDLTAS